MSKPPEIPKLIPHIPLPFEEVMKDVLKVKPPARIPRKRTKKGKAKPVASSNS